jgi:hypothetical protein
MLVFIDESGDPGFKLEKGASPIFAAAMVIFETKEAASITQRVIEESEARRIHKGEFKFNKCSHDVRDIFFHAIRRCPFKVRAIMVRKNMIHSPRLKSDKDKFYEYFVKSMLNYDNGILKEATIVIDGSGDREFRQNLNTALRRKLGSGIIKDIRFKNSRADLLVQLADMCVGAIARSYRHDRNQSDRWRKQLAPRIDDVWDFR